MYSSLMPNSGGPDDCLMRSLASDLVPEDHPDRSQLLALLKSNTSTAQRDRASNSKPDKSAVEAQEAADSNLHPQVAAFKVSKGGAPTLAL